MVGALIHPFRGLADSCAIFRLLHSSWFDPQVVHHSSRFCDPNLWIALFGGKWPFSFPRRVQFRCAICGQSWVPKRTWVGPVHTHTLLVLALLLKFFPPVLRAFGIMEVRASHKSDCFFVALLASQILIFTRVALPSTFVGGV